MAGKQPSQRQLRVGEEIRHALARIFLEGELRDPDLAEASITITEVRLSPDLGTATAFIMPLGGVDQKPVLDALKRAAPFLRGQVSAALTLRYTPRLRFELDRSFEEAQKIESLLRSDRVKRDLGAGASDDDKES
jgi:ribosome-binding factor A